MRLRAVALPSASAGAVYRRRADPPHDGQGAVALTEAIGIVTVETPCSLQMNSYIAISVLPCCP